MLTPLGCLVIAWTRSNLIRRRLAERALAKDDLFRLSAFSLYPRSVERRTSRPCDGAELRLIKRDAYLINNLARSPIVSRAELIAALRSGRRAAHGVAVFPISTAPGRPSFRSMDNVTISPHLG